MLISLISPFVKWLSMFILFNDAFFQYFCIRILIIRVMKVLVFIFIVFSFLGVSAEENMSIEKEYDVVCSIYNGGRHNSNKAPLRYNRILLQVTELMVAVVDGADSPQPSVLSFYSGDGTLLYRKQCILENGVVISMAPDIINKVSRITIVLNDCEFIGFIK